MKKSVDFFSCMSDIALRKTKYRVKQSESLHIVRDPPPKFIQGEEFPIRKQNKFVTIDYGTKPGDRCAHPVLQYAKKLHQTKCGLKLKTRDAILQKRFNEMIAKGFDSSRRVTIQNMMYEEQDCISIEVSTDVDQEDDQYDEFATKQERKIKRIKIPKKLKDLQDGSRLMDIKADAEREKYQKLVMSQQKKMHYLPKILEIAKNQKFKFYRYQQIKRRAQQKRRLHLSVEIEKLKEERYARVRERILKQKLERERILRQQEQYAAEQVAVIQNKRPRMRELDKRVASFRKIN